MAKINKLKDSLVIANRNKDTAKSEEIVSKIDELEEKVRTSTKVLKNECKKLFKMIFNWAFKRCINCFHNGNNP